jgi:hypothetical protein
MSPNPRQINGESGRVWAMGRFGEVSHSEAKEIFFFFFVSKISPDNYLCPAAGDLRYSQPSRSIWMVPPHV